MKLVESLLTKNPCYLAGKKIKVKGIMLHSVGCPQPKATAFINSWNTASFDNACVHGFIDGLDGMVYQTLPWEHRGWHCGSGSKGSGNDGYIGIEMCEPECIKYTSGSNFTCSDVNQAKVIVERTYQAAVELFAMLCRKYDLDPEVDGVIISHKEGHRQGIASNHGDPEHLWKQLGMDYTMDDFRKAVKSAINGSVAEGTNGTQATKGSSGVVATWYRVRKSWGDSTSQKGAFQNLDNAKKCADSHEGHSVFDESGTALYTSKSVLPYLVRVTATDLNIRKGPGTNYSKTGKYTGVGTFTIVEESDGKGASKWGRLKSGMGWVSLDYCQKC